MLYELPSEYLEICPELQNHYLVDYKFDVQLNKVGHESPCFKASLIWNIKNSIIKLLGIELLPIS